MVDEPVRGGFPDPSFSSLPGIDQARAWLRGCAPTSPLYHLLGIRPTQIGPGSATLVQPATEALLTFDGPVEGHALMQEALDTAVLTTAPAGHDVRMGVFAVDYLRPSTLRSETLVAKARTVHSGRTFTLAEVLLEDAIGRGIAHANGTFVIRPIDPPPPPWVGRLEPLPVPQYPTPDPYLRNMPSTAFTADAGVSAREFLRDIMNGSRPSPPASQLFGVRLLEVEEGAVSGAFPATEWVCSRTRRVAPGVIAYLTTVGHGSAATLMPPGHRLGVLHQTLNFLRPVAPDGHDVIARSRVTHQGQEFVASEVEVSDGAGNTVAVGSLTSLFIARSHDRAHAADRVVATVLFTDIVGSTEQAGKLGDARWGELLDAHHAAIRTQLEVFKGREVKTTGDGFLAVFDSPSRAVQAARAMRDSVRRLGLEIRAGLHTGECEASGADVAGIAVHIASRIQALAGPAEILVSSTVRELVTGSGLRFTDRGRHALRGIEEEWPVYALES